VLYEGCGAEEKFSASKRGPENNDAGSDGIDPRKSSWPWRQRQFGNAPRIKTGARFAWKAGVVFSAVMRALAPKFGKIESLNHRIIRSLLLTTIDDPCD